MKKYLIFTFIALGVMLLSSLHYFNGGDPILPATPYSYEIDLLPDHLDSTNYGVTSDTILSFVDDRIATLGRVLFYDELLSATEDISCGTCHLQQFSFADSLTFSHGVNSSTARNSLQLNDLGWSNQTTFFWDMKISSPTPLLDTLLASAIKLPLTDPNEIGVSDVNVMIQKMNSTTYYPGLFSDAFGSPTITEPLITEALSNFISSMVTFDSKFDQSSTLGSSVTLTTQEANGKLLFETDCQICHADGSNFFTDGGPTHAPLPVYDNGMERDSSDLGAGEWLPGFEYQYKIPTLRNIEVTGPYMHDGRFTTLEEVINHYSDSVIVASQWIISPGFGYTQTEKDELVAFLKTLTSPNLLTHDKWSDPFPGLSTDLDDQDASTLTVNVFPNPSSEVATIQFKNERRQMTYLKVFSTNGQLMAHRSTHKSAIRITVTDYPAGTYMVKLSQEDQEITKQLVVVH